MVNPDLDKLARLARLELQDVQGLADELQELVFLANKLDALDLSGEEYGDSMPLAQLREDVSIPFTISREAFLCNAPEREKGCIAVPKVAGV